MNDYEQRKQARIDRYREQADKAQAESTSLHNQAWDMLSAIPMGQPIHGTADRNYRNRIDQKMGKSITASEKADYYRHKAEAAENNTAISSDDPQAVEKLTAKLESLKAGQERMKAINAYYRKHGTCRGMEGMSDEQADKIDQAVKDGPPWLSNVPFASYVLSNNNQEIHRLQDRLKKLTEARELGYTGWAFEGGRVEANEDKNRLQIFFDEIPGEDVRRELKGRGFRWARSEGAWQRQLNDNAIYAASHIEAIRPIDGSDPLKIQPKRKQQGGPAR